MMHPYQKHFMHGYICAVATLLRSHGDSTEAHDLFKQSGYKIKELIEAGCEREDIEIIKKHWGDENNNRQ